MIVAIYEVSRDKMSNYFLHIIFNILVNHFLEF